MSNDIITHMQKAYDRAVFPDEDEQPMEAAASVLLDWLGTFHGIPASELLQARRELGLTSTAAAEPATEPGEDTGQPYTGRIELAGERFGECVGPEEFGQLDEQGRWVPKTGQIVDKKV